uniref:Methyltransferase domain-containing protein n=1 Tax=Plectus sambesii TaxID=2011161 RepID=A0A914WSZ2_9BILA
MVKYTGSAGINFDASTPELAEKGFDGWAKTYEADSDLHHYNGPKQLADIAKKYLKPTDLILVTCVGTGLELPHLHAAGLTNLHGQDGSKEMLSIANSKGLLKESFHELLFPGKTSNLKSHFYDATVNVGSINRRGLDARYMDDLVRTVAVGGVFIIGLRDTWLEPRPDLDYPYDLTAKMNEMESNGKLQLIERTVTQEFYDGMDGVFFVYRVQ